MSRTKAVKAEKNLQAIIEEHAPIRWTCNHHSDSSDIEAYVPETGGLTVIGEMRQAEGMSARANAEFIIKAVNDYEKNQSLIAALIGALELCLECKGISWEAEQEGLVVLKRAAQETGRNSVSQDI